jgi:CheY-like chemotaxis protein
MRGLSQDPTTCDIPVIFLTAKSQGDEQMWIVDAGARGLINKPFDPLSLANEVEIILASSLHGAADGQ